MSRELKYFPNLTFDPQGLVGRVDFGDIFGRIAPVHIEIGSGKGTFLVNQARFQPGDNFIGIEWANRYFRYAVDRIGRWNLNNVRIIRTDAAKFIAENVPDESVDCFHIYFPDPWPKKRHHKRRFFNPANTEQLIRCLKAGGTINVATDYAEYFEQIKQVISAKGDALKEINFLPTAGAQIGEWVGTNFERKYRKESRPIYTMAVRKNTKNFTTGIAMKSRFNLNMHDYIHQPEGKLVFNKRLFSHIAPKYNFINRVLSFDRDKTWKKRLVEDLPDLKAPDCLDIACGTGDITFRLAAKYPQGLIVGLDLTEPMIDLAKTRDKFANITFEIGDMCKMSFADNSFDIVTGGYALRNAPNLEQTLLEIRRVMKPGATAAFLDFSKSPNRFLRVAQDFLLRFWGGLWGIVLYRNPQLYTYIAASLRQFPDSTALKQLIANLGFTNIRSRKHFFGFTETILFQKR